MRRETKGGDKIAADKEHKGSKEKKAEIREPVCLSISPGARGWMWLPFLATSSIPYAQFLLNDTSENSLRCHLKGDPSLVSCACRSTAEAQDTGSQQPWHTLHAAESKLQETPSMSISTLSWIYMTSATTYPHTAGGTARRALHRQRTEAQTLLCTHTACLGCSHNLRHLKRKRMMSNSRHPSPMAQPREKPTQKYRSQEGKRDASPDLPIPLAFLTWPVLLTTRHLRQGKLPQQP